MQHWEERFKSWAKSLDQDGQVKCDSTEQIIKDVMKQNKILSEMHIDVKPHGSYRTNTAIRKKSDVDIRVCLTDNFYYSLPPSITKKPQEINKRDTSLKYKDFKQKVGDVLISRFGKSVKRRNKAFKVYTKAGRVDMDVVAAFEYRRYTGQCNADGTFQYHTGITFLCEDGRQVINWPEQTKENGDEKERETNHCYKKVIRILKSLRDEMQKSENPQAYNFTSFLIESLVWNVPNECFDHPRLYDTVHCVLNYCKNNILDSCRHGKWYEVNGLKPLFKKSQRWTRQQAHQFVSAAWKYVGFE